MRDIFISVIIPTFNRFSSLGNTLDSISQSNFDLTRVEVIVVDDGSSDNTPDIQNNFYPFHFRYFKQSNQGDAHARNFGAQKSVGTLLIFIDDDIHLLPDFFLSITSVHRNRDRVIVVGNLISITQKGLLHYKNLSFIHNHDNEEAISVPFSACKSGLMAISRPDFFHLGMMQPLAIKGSSIWCDVEMAYRAHLINFIFLKSPQAIGFHDDYTEYNLEAKTKRMYRAAKESILLFQRHPEIQQHLPMFHDKTPILWQNDPPRLIARKITRSLVSTRLVLGCLEMTYKAFTLSPYFAFVCAVLERWIIGGYIYCGYRQGLREYRGQSSNGLITPSPNS